MRWWFSFGWLCGIWEKRRQHQPARRWLRFIQPRLEPLEDRRLFANNVWLPTQLAAFDGASQTNQAMPLFQPATTTFLPQLELQNTTVSANGSVNLTDNGNYQLTLTQSGPYDANGDRYTFKESGPVSFSLVELGTLSATGFSITSVTLTQTATLSWSLVETNSSGQTVQNTSGNNLFIAHDNGAAPNDPFFTPGFNWLSLTQLVSSLNALGLSSLAADSLSVQETAGSEGYTFKESNGLATVQGNVVQPLSDSLLESGQKNYTDTAVERFSSTVTGSDSFSLSELGRYSSGSYALSSIAYRENGTQTRQFNATVVDSPSGSGSESGAQSFSGNNHALGDSSSDSFQFSDVSTLSYGETASSAFALTQQGSYGGGSFNLNSLTYTDNGSGGYSLTRTSLQTQTGSFSDSSNGSGTDSFGVAGSQTDSGNATDSGHFTTTSSGTLHDNESGLFTLSEAGGYGDGRWALSSYNLSESLSGSYSRQQLATTTQSGNSTNTDSGTGSDSFVLNFGATSSSSGGDTLNSTDTSTDSFTLVSTDSSTYSGASSYTLNLLGSLQGGVPTLTRYAFTSGQSGTYNASGNSLETDTGGSQDSASGSDNAVETASNGGWSGNSTGNDNSSGSDSFSFTSIQSSTSTDSGNFSDNVSQVGVFNNGSYALSSVVNTSYQNDNGSQTSTESSTRSGSFSSSGGGSGQNNDTVLFGSDSATNADGNSASGSDFGTFVDTSFDTITATGFSQSTLSKLGSYGNYSFSYGTVTQQGNGTSTDTTRNSDVENYTDTFSDSSSDNSNDTSIACLANSTDTGSGHVNDSGNDNYTETGIDTSTETLTGTDSYNVFESGSFLGGLWNLSSVSYGDSSSDSFSEQDLDSSTDSGTQGFSANDSGNSGDTNVFGSGSLTASNYGNGTVSSSESFTQYNHDTVTDSGTDSSSVSEQGSYGHFSFAFTSLVNQGGDSSTETTVATSHGTSVGVQSDTSSDGGSDNGLGTYAFGNDSNTNSENDSGNDSFSTGGSNSMTETITGGESSSFYESGQFSNGSLSLSLASYHSGGNDSWSRLSNATTTASGTIGGSDSSSASESLSRSSGLGCLMGGPSGSSGDSGGDGGSRFGSESATSFDSSTASGHDSWSLTQIGSFSNFSTSYSSYVSQDSGSSSESSSDSSTESFVGTVSENTNSSDSLSNSGSSGYDNLNDQAGDNSNAGDDVHETALSQTNETVTASDSSSDYEVGIFNGNSWSLSSVSNFSGHNETWTAQSNATITDVGPETVSGGLSFSGGDSVNGYGGVTVSSADTLNASQTLNGTDTRTAYTNATESGNDSSTQSESGSYGNFSYTFTNVVNQSGGSSSGCMQETSVDTFLGSFTGNDSDSGQQSGSDSLGQDDGNDNNQFSDSDNANASQEIDSRGTVTGGDSDVWSDYESGSYAGDSYAFSSINYQDNGSDSTTETSLATSYGTLSGSGNESGSAGGGLGCGMYASSSGNASGSSSGHDTGTSSSTLQSGDSWSLSELGRASNGSYSLSSYAYSSSDSSSLQAQQTDTIGATVTGGGSLSDNSNDGDNTSVNGTWTSTGTMPTSGTFTLGLNDSESDNDYGSFTETTALTETITSTQLETVSSSLSQLGIYAAGSFNLSSVVYTQNSSNSLTETATDASTSAETNQDNPSDDANQDGYGSDGYDVSGNASDSGQETATGGDTTVKQSQSSESLYQAGSFSNDSYSLSSYSFSAQGNDTLTSSSSDTLTSSSAGSDSGLESIDYYTVYNGNGTFTTTGSGGDGSASTQTSGWQLTELGSLASGVLSLSCYVLSVQQNSSESSNDSSGWTETLSGTNQGDTFSGTDSGSQNDNQNSTSSSSLLEQGTATGDVLTLSLVSYSASGNASGNTSENEGGVWSGPSYSGNDADGAQAGDSGNYRVSALGSYANGSFSLSNYVVQGSSTETSSSHANELDTLLSMGCLGTMPVAQNYSRSDTTANRDSSSFYQSGGETAGSYANQSYNVTYGSGATVTEGTAVPSYSSGDTWQTTATQTETLSGASATNSSSLTFQDSYNTGSGGCWTQNAPQWTVPGLLVNLATPDASSLPVVGANESPGGMPISHPNLGVVAATTQLLSVTAAAAREEVQPDNAKPVVPDNGGGAPAQAPAPPESGGLLSGLWNGIKTGASNLADEATMIGSYLVNHPGEAWREANRGADQGAALMLNQVTFGTTYQEEARVAEQELGPMTTTVVRLAGSTAAVSLIAAAAPAAGVTSGTVLAGAGVGVVVTGAYQTGQIVDGKRDGYDVAAMGSGGQLGALAPLVQNAFPALAQEATAAAVAGTAAYGAQKMQQGEPATGAVALATAGVGY